MANRWGNNETVRDFILGGSKITADGNCSHEIKRCLLLGRNAMTNLDIILKSVSTAEFSRFAGTLSAALSQHHLFGFKIAELKFHHLH